MPAAARIREDGKGALDRHMEQPRQVDLGACSPAWHSKHQLVEI